MKKYDFLNLIKTISMFLVVLAHCSFFYSSNQFWAIKADSQYLPAVFGTNVLDYSLVAIFVFASGFLFCKSFDKPGTTTGKLIKSRVLRLLVPWFIYGVLYLVPIYTFFDIASFGRNEGASYAEGYIAFLLGKFADAAWFLLMLFWVSLIWIIFRKCLERNNLKYGAFITILLVVGSHYFLSDIDYYKLSQIDQYILYFFLGSTCYRFMEEFEKLSILKLRCFAYPALTFVLVAAQFADSNYILGIITRCIATLAAFFLGLICSRRGICERFEKNRFYKWVVKHNMNIYLFQTPWLYLFYGMLYPYIGKMPLLCIVINFTLTLAVIIVICLFIDWINIRRVNITNKLSRRFKDAPLLFRIIVIFNLSIVMTIAFNCFAGFYADRKLQLDQLESANRSLAEYAVTEITKMGNTEFLFNYWHDNYEIMDITYDDKAALDRKLSRFNNLNPVLSIDYVNKHNLITMSEESRKLYAEISFMRLIDVFDRLKRIYHPLYLYCCRADSDTELFYYATGAEENEIRGTSEDTIFTLGTKAPYNLTDLPVLAKTLEMKAEVNEMEQQAGNFYHVYTPILDSDGEVLCFIGVTMESNSVEKQIINMLLQGQIVSAFILFLAGIALVIVVRKVILNPLGFVHDTVIRYSHSKDSKAAVETIAKYDSKNEIGNLAREFSDLTVEIDRYTNEITSMAAEKQRISTELSLATTIQASYLPCTFPPFPERFEFELFATMDPAKEVGGDFYDFFLIDDNHLGLVIADVSGKGIPASLFMMISKTLIKNQCYFLTSPAEIMTTVNKQLCENNEAEMFVTVWLGILEISTGKMLCSSAGHEYPAIKRAGGEFEIFKDKHGMVLGGIDIAKYKEYELQMNPGDEIFVYTDGVAEATSAENELFGTGRMIEALNQNANATVEELTENVKAAIDGFVKEAPQFDDITMLAFKYLGSK